VQEDVLYHKLKIHVVVTPLNLNKVSKILTGEKSRFCHVFAD